MYFFKLLTVKRFLDKVFRGDNERFYFRDNTINDFENAKADVGQKKKKKRINGCINLRS